MQNNITPEQEEDIKNRVEAAKVYLKENNLDIAAQTLTPNLGNLDSKFNNIFGFYVQPYICDTKFLNKKDEPTQEA